MILPGYKVADIHLKTAKRKKSFVIILTKGNVRTMFLKMKHFRHNKAGLPGAMDICCSSLPAAIHTVKCAHTPDIAIL